jgi:hypothetical protein
MSFKGLAAAASVAALLAAGTARADEPAVSPADIAALTAPAQRLVDAINQASAAVPKDVFTRDAVVLDDFAPYHWNGKTHATDWYKGLLGATPKDHDDFVASKGVVKLGTAAFPMITGDHAYVVFPSSFDFNDGGKRTHMTAQWLFIEERVKGNWLIAGHSWAITAQGPAGP